MRMNRLWNINNPYQGKDKKVLCICSAGLLRSPTAANVLHNEFGFNTRSAGCDIDHALIPIDEVLISWADEIVVMEDYHAEIVTVFADKNMVHIPILTVLNIEDTYEYNDSDLKNLIVERYKESLE